MATNFSKKGLNIVDISRSSSPSLIKEVTALGFVFYFHLKDLDQTYDVAISPVSHRKNIRF